MPASEVDWLPAIVALAAGLVVASVLLWRWRRGPQADATEPTLDDTPRQELLGERDSLLRRLREMDRSDGDDAIAAQRYELELRTAGVLRALDELPEAEAGAEPAVAASAQTPGGAMSGFLWGAVSATAIAVVITFASRDATPRNEGGSVTGGLESAGDASSRPVEGPEAAAVARNPDDLDARLDLARSHLERQDLMAVFEETQFVLERVPGHPRALSYQSLVRLAMGQGDLAVQMLEQAIAGEPDALEPYVHMALVQVKLGRETEADAAIAEAATRHPREATRLSDLLDELKRAARDDPSPVADTHPEVPPPAHSNPAGIAGTVELARSGPAPSGVLFVMARSVRQMEGPPLAVKRMVVHSFPVRFSLGAADSMMGQELPETLRIEARLDLDGDPMTRDAADPKALVEEVKLGRGDLRIVLGASN